MAIDLIENGDLLGDVRVLKLNASISKLNDIVEDVDNLNTYNTRVKSEIDWSGLSLVLTANTPYNMVSILKTTPSASGTLAPFFNEVSDKMVVGLNDNKTLHWKIVIEGLFTGPVGSSTGALSLELTGGVNEKYINQRDNVVGTDIFNFNSFISVDKNGVFSTNGASVMITSLIRDFTVNRVRLIAEQ